MERIRKLTKQESALIRKIGTQVHGKHGDWEAEYIATALLSTASPGPVVECGCYKGAMTCKLSHICAATGRKLFVFDTFAGLPYSEELELNTGQWFRGHRPKTHRFRVGDYACDLDTVRRAVDKFGRPEVVEYVEGVFEDTLPRHPDLNPSLVFVDADLVRSSRDCLKHLWPQLRGGHFFHHEAIFKGYIEGVTDREWWRTTLGQNPPKFQTVRKEFALGFQYKELKLI